MELIWGICRQLFLLPMIFWGPLTGPGGRKEKPMWLVISFAGLDPDGRLVADLRKNPHQIS
jgi:hypothetical protein